MRILFAIAVCLALLSSQARAQTPAVDPLGWNSARAQQLIERARARRELPRGDSTLFNYQAKANGFVYFYLDRRAENDRTLVKVDQIALDLYWKRPNLTKQRIVGMRDVSRLPNRMYYHLDHLTVVQNNLGDVIRIGDGDEVRDVPHPAAPGSDSVYDFRLADSVTLRLGGEQPDVRVYEVQVRPKRTDRPGLVGSVYVDRAAADIVRMTFTFTPASYVDRRLDYINISLDNGLFGGKYWLPSEQSVEIRRQIPELDFAAGAVIKGHLRVSAYDFNAEIPDSMFYGRRVTAAYKDERESYPFAEDIYAGINEEGLAPPPEMADLRARAAALIGESRLSGLPPFRLYVPNASSVLRRNDSEGWYAGLGVTYTPVPSLHVDVTGGYAFRLAEPEAEAALRFLDDKGVQSSARVYYNTPRDIGPVTGLPGVLNTLSTSFGGADYTDLYFSRGASLAIAAPVFAPQWQVRVSISGEDQDAPYADAEAAVHTAFETQTVNAGRAFTFETALAREPAEASGFSWNGTAKLAAISFKPSHDTPLLFGERSLFVRGLLNVNAQFISDDKRHDGRAGVIFGKNFGDAPGQYFFSLGGRETLPGYDYRSFVSPEVIGLARAEYSRTIAPPWLRFRLLGYASYSRETTEELYDDIILPVTASHLRGSAGVGLGLLWDVLRVDVIKGAYWQTVLSVRPDLSDLL